MVHDRDRVSGWSDYPPPYIVNLRTDDYNCSALFPSTWNVYIIQREWIWIFNRISLAIYDAVRIRWKALANKIWTQFWAALLPWGYIVHYLRIQDVLILPKCNSLILKQTQDPVVPVRCSWCIRQRFTSVTPPITNRARIYRYACCVYCLCIWFRFALKIPL